MPSHFPAAMTVLPPDFLDEAVVGFDQEKLARLLGLA
jgi:hypothetical protein